TRMSLPIRYPRTVPSAMRRRIVFVETPNISAAFVSEMSPCSGLSDRVRTVMVIPPGRLVGFTSQVPLGVHVRRRSARRTSLSLRNPRRHTVTHSVGKLSLAAHRRVLIAQHDVNIRVATTPHQFGERRS